MQTENKNVDKKLHIELMRIIAIVLVVLNHSDLFYTFYSNTENAITFSISLLISSICKANVPLFLMITGALLIPRVESWNVVWKKRIPRILKVLVAFSLLMYSLQSFVWKQTTFSLGEFIWKMLNNDIQVSYWFLYEYIGILLMIPFVGIMARNMDNEHLKCLLGIGIVFKVGVYAVELFGGYYLPINAFIVEDGVFYVLLGYYLENRVTEEKYRRLSYSKSVMGVVGVVSMTIAMVLIDKGISGEYDERVLSIMTPILVILIYIIVRKYYIDYVNIEYGNLLGFLGSCTFGVYLIEHIGQKLFINMYLWLCDKTFGVIACSIYVISILIFCFSIVGICKKIMR